MESSVPRQYLIDFLPRNGFLWNEEPRVTRTDARDASIVAAFREITGRRRPYKSQVLPIVGRIFEYLAAEIDTIGGGMEGNVTFDNAGNKNYENIHDFLLRIREEAIRYVAAGSRPYLRLLTILPADTWIDLVYRIVKGHEDWENEIPDELKEEFAATLPHLYRCVWRFRDAAQHVWERDREILVAAIDPRGYLDEMVGAGDSVPWEGHANWVQWAMEEDHDVNMVDADAGGEAADVGPSSADGAVGSLGEGISMLDIESMEVEGADMDVDLYSAED